MNNENEVNLPNISSNDDDEFVPIKKKRLVVLTDSTDSDTYKIYFCFLKCHYYFFVKLREINIYFYNLYQLLFPFLIDSKTIPRETDAVRKLRDMCIQQVNKQLENKRIGTAANVSEETNIS